MSRIREAFAAMDPLHRRFCRVLAVYAAAALIVFAWGIVSGRADTIGFRIELKACRGDACRSVRVSDAIWSAQFACDARAELVQREAAEMMEPFGLAGGPWSVRARCVPVSGMPSA